jgi:hypothetical protein
MEAMTQVFISYSRTDMEFVQHLAMDLQRAGLDVWWDLSDIQGSDIWERKIEEGLRSSQYFIVVLTPASLESRWVRREYLSADNKSLKIIPLKLKDFGEAPLTLRDIQPIDATNRPYDDVLSDVLRILKVQADVSLADVEGKKFSGKEFLNRMVGSIFSKGSGEVNVGGTLLLTLFFLLAGLDALGSSDDTVEILLGISAILASMAFLRRKQVPATIMFKISAIIFLLIYGQGYRLDEIYGGIAALITGGILVVTLRTPKKPVFYSSISFALFLFLVGIYWIGGNVGFSPNVDTLVMITSIVTSILLLMDL